MLDPAAVVFVLSRHVFVDTSLYVQYCIDRGYRPLGVIKGDLSVALRLLKAGAIQVIVFAPHERQVLDGAPLPQPGVRRCASAAARPKHRLHLRPRADDLRLAEGTGEVDPPFVKEVDSYRDGYADGYVDAATLRAPGRF